MRKWLNRLRGKRLDPAILPEVLAPLLPYAEQYGVDEDSDEFLTLLKRARRSDGFLAEMKACGALWTPKVGDAVEGLWDLDEHAAMRFSALALLLDACAVLPGTPPEDELTSALHNLHHPKHKLDRQFGCIRLGQMRMDAEAALDDLLQFAEQPGQDRAHAIMAIAHIKDDRPWARELLALLRTQPGAGPIVNVEEYLQRTNEQLDSGRIGGACIGERPDVIRHVARRADVNLPDHNGTPPIVLAVGNDKPEALRALLECGADPNLRHRGETPLHAAARSIGGRNTIAILRDAGARLDERDDKGMTPVDIAVEYGIPRNQKLLR
ncbi:MAG: ankyrin repeat domain-containing protein [Planctomycetota bacterium]